jgi:rSAM/selenodomain-associated transferase 2
MKLSIIVPVLNEAHGIVASLQALQALRQRGAQVILVDGGSIDASVSLGSPLADQTILTATGRALQQNEGAWRAAGDTFLFLHSDTTLPIDADAMIANALTSPSAMWGRFDVAFSPNTRTLSLVASMMNARSRITGVATGDQALFVRRSAFVDVGGFPAIPLMEDVALSKRLKKIVAPVCLRARVTTSSRRWRRYGAWRTIVLMWVLRLAFVMGVSPERLARWYRVDAGFANRGDRLS